MLQSKFRSFVILAVAVYLDDVTVTCTGEHGVKVTAGVTSFSETLRVVFSFEGDVPGSPFKVT